ncbi:MAG: glycosyltransferase family 39 protein [Candidatus Aenigmarchaeota archaeon]|nr:glycosyltransferase family 39 protein [Candidatus Aenigmarchaeota archaeon]
MSKINPKLILLVFLVAYTFFFFSQRYKPLWTDESVYISIGKYCMSHGEIGFFESLRPPVYPLFLGVLWKVGADQLLFGRIFAILFSLATIWVSYLLASRIFNRNIGIISMILVGITYQFIFFSDKLLTDIPSTMLALVSIYLITGKNSKRNMFLAGITAGLAFLTKFPQGIVFVSLCLYLLLRKKRKNLLVLILGFGLVLSPYLLYNHIAYSNMLLPFEKARYIMKTTAWYYDSGLFYYFRRLPISNYFFIFSIAGLIYFFKSKDYKHKIKLTLFLILALFFSYFTLLVHKELRYSIIFLPYLAMLSAYGIEKLRKKIKLKSVFNYFMIFLFVAFFVQTVGMLNEADKTPERGNFYNFIRETKFNGTIMTTNMAAGYYTNNKIAIINSWKSSKLNKIAVNYLKDVNLLYINQLDDAKRIFNLTNTTTVIVDSCLPPCPKDDKECFEIKDNFIKFLKTYKIIFEDNDEKCDYLVISVEEARR